MRKWSILWSLLVTIMVVAQPSASIKPGQLWPDTDGQHINAHGGGVLLHCGTYYWFGEHKDERTSAALVGVNCYASTDMVHWQKRGVALSVSTERGHDLERGCVIERPKVVYNEKTGQFVMWFHLELRHRGYEAARFGVAVSDKPEGPYTYIYSGRVNAGRWPVEFAAELTDDYLHHTGRYTRLAPGGHNEAPAVFKHDGTYWMITSGCTGWDPNEARLFSAPSIWGPWKQHANPCVGPAADKTFGGQSTFVLTLPDGRHIFMADIWRPWRPIDARYIWLPITFCDGKPQIKWQEEWSL